MNNTLSFIDAAEETEPLIHNETTDEKKNVALKKLQKAPVMVVSLDGKQPSAE